MYSTFNNDTLACLVKSNPELDSVIQAIITDNKKATSMLVHELRNPLSLLKGTIQYMETKHPEAREFKYWDQIQDLITDMDRIMTDASLLNTMNLIHKEPTNLVTFINNLTNSFMPQALTKSIDLTFSYDQEVVEYVRAYSCDSVKIKQVMINLIKNAFEATDSGSFIHINLSFLPEDISAPPKIQIMISNNGQPIPEDVLENIFIPFVTYKKGGTGVGLALVKKVVDLHYGSVRVESKEGLTSFIIQLPV